MHIYFFPFFKKHFFLKALNIASVNRCEYFTKLFKKYKTKISTRKKPSNFMLNNTSNTDSNNRITTTL